MAKTAKHLSELSLLDASEGRALSLAAQKHLEACSRCRADVAGLSRASQAFDGPGLAPPRALRMAVRERLGLKPKPLQQPWLRWSLAGASVAAALALIFSSNPASLPLPTPQENDPQMAQVKPAPKKSPAELASRPKWPRC